jgi:hypothetical protein
VVVVVVGAAEAEAAAVVPRPHDHSYVRSIEPMVAVVVYVWVYARMCDRVRACVRACVRGGVTHQAATMVVTLSVLSHHPVVDESALMYLESIQWEPGWAFCRYSWVRSEAITAPAAAEHARTAMMQRSTARLRRAEK